MAINEVYNKAESLVLGYGSTDPSVKSGFPTIVGTLCGVAETDSAKAADNNYYATVKFNGVFRFDMSASSPGTSLDTLKGLQLTIGQAVYITSAGVLNTTATSNTLFGHAIRAKTATTAVAANEAFIRLYGC